MPLTCENQTLQCAPRLTWFPEVCPDVGPQQPFVVYPGPECDPLGADVEAIAPVELMQELQAMIKEELELPRWP
jgi:hypothetical protein